MYPMACIFHFQDGIIWKILIAGIPIIGIDIIRKLSFDESRFYLVKILSDLGKSISNR
jgi:hypothetical protein